MDIAVYSAFTHQIIRFFKELFKNMLILKVIEIKVMSPLKQKFCL